MVLLNFVALGQIDTKHNGSYVCVCTHEYCHESSGKKVNILIQSQSNQITIDYEDEIHSGAPAVIVDKKSGFVTYQLASGGKIGFLPDGTPAFGWGKLWTCTPSH